MFKWGNDYAVEVVAETLDIKAEIQLKSLEIVTV